VWSALLRRRGAMAEAAAAAITARGADRARWRSRTRTIGTSGREVTTFELFSNVRGIPTGTESGQLHDPTSRGKLERIMSSTTYDFFMSVVIVANCVNVGFEQSYRLAGADASLFLYIEHGFLIAFILELLLRFYAEGLKCLHNNWVCFDVVLVGLGVLLAWVLHPLISGTEGWENLLVLRTVRLCRLARSVKLLVRYRELWMMVRGMLSSIGTVFHTVILCILILYIFGCICIELIPLGLAKDELSEEAQQIIEMNFRNLPIAMLTLVQFISFDNISLVYKPLVEEHFVLCFLFVTIILFVGIVLMNLVTAVIVNSALEQAMADKDLIKAKDEAREKKLLICKVRAAFQSLDEDGSGDITREELLNMGEDMKRHMTELLCTDDPVEVFDSLDVDGSGDISIQEFCQGIEDIVFGNRPIEFKRMETQIKSMLKQMRVCRESILKLLHQFEHERDLRTKSLSPPDEDTSQCGKDVDAVLVDPKEVEVQVDTNGDQDIFNSNLSAETEAVKSDDGLRPAWADQMLLELRQLCTSDVRKTMYEACNAFMDQVADGTNSERVVAPWTRQSSADSYDTYTHDVPGPEMQRRRSRDPLDFPRRTTSPPSLDQHALRLSSPAGSRRSSTRWYRQISTEAPVWSRTTTPGTYEPESQLYYPVRNGGIPPSSRPTLLMGTATQPRTPRRSRR